MTLKWAKMYNPCNEELGETCHWLEDHCVKYVFIDMYCVMCKFRNDITIP